MSIIVILIAVLILLQFKAVRFIIGLFALFVVYHMMTSQPETKMEKTFDQAWDEAVSR